LDRLEVAHTATIEWLETRLAEVAKTGSSALEATPVQAAVMAARRVLHAPFGVAAVGVNRVSGLVQRFGGKAVETVTAQAGEVVDQVQDKAGDVKDAAKDKAGDLTDAARDVYPSETPAPDEFGAVGSLNDNTGVEADGEHAPFAGYDKLGGDRVMAHVAQSNDIPDLQVLLTYETAHKNRKGVVQAVEERLSALGASA
ncbi:MAG: hypothetical protein ABR614_13795, partial [Mycobacteriales bacterium]